MGYLLKSTPQEEIINAVKMVRNGVHCIPSNIAQRLPEMIAREELSQPELEVLTLAAKGLTNKTARNHTANCLLKLRANDRTEAATAAIQRGPIRLGE